MVTVSDHTVCVFLDFEALWEESKVPVWRDILGTARHPTAHSPTPKETMKTEGGRQDAENERRERQRGDCPPTPNPVGFSLHDSQATLGRRRNTTDQHNNLKKQKKTPE